MANIESAIKVIQQAEGGWSNNPNDKGGATMKGITLNTYRYYFGKDKTAKDLKNISDEDWTYIFRKGFWEKVKGDDIKSQSIANIIVDYAFNSGTKLSIRKVQKLLNVPADGIVGKVTLHSINNYPNQRQLFEKIKSMRLSYYYAIIEKNPSQKVFLKGWRNRIENLKWVD